MCGLVGAGDEEEVCDEDEPAAGEELPGEMLVGVGDCFPPVCGVVFPPRFIPMPKLLLALLALLAAPAFSAPNPVPAGANPFFSMNTIARGGPDAVVPLLKEPGFDGLDGRRIYSPRRTRRARRQSNSVFSLSSVV